MATSLRCKVEEHLTCSVCLEQYKDPKVLPCLHSYCHECIVKLAKNAKTESIACPECRLEVKIEDQQNFSFLPTNFFVNNLLATMALADDQKTKEIPCDNCDSGDVAETRCQECGIFLCHFCTESHKRYRATKLHQLLSMEQLKSRAGPDTIAEKIRCAKHKEEVIKLYCKTCQVTICRDCTIVDHREHEYGFVEDVALKEKQNLQENLDEVKQRKVKVLEGIVSLKKVDESLVARKEVTISQINNHFEQLANALAFRKKELVEKAESLTTSKQKQIRAQLEQLEMALASCESSIDFTEQAFKNGNDVQILSMQKFILDSLQNLKRVKDQTRPCVSGAIVLSISNLKTIEEAKKELFNLFMVDDGETCPENCKASYSGPNEDLKPGEQSTITVICNDKFNRRVQCGGQVINPMFTGAEVSGVTVTDNNDGSHTVSFIPRSGGVLKFDVSIDGTPAPSCSLTKKVKWVMSDAYGAGRITDDGLTMMSDEGYCYRVGGCYFESGVHTWKVRLSQAQDRMLFCFSDPKAEVGVVDWAEIDPNTKSSVHPDILDHGKCLHVSLWPIGQTFDVDLKLDMGNKTLEILNYEPNPVCACYGTERYFGTAARKKNKNVVMRNKSRGRIHRFTAERVCPFFASSSSSVSISIVE